MSPGPKRPSDRGSRSGDEHGKAIAPGTFRIERWLPGPIERLWAYLIDPEKRKKWFGAGPMELRAAGRVELRFRFSELTSEKTPPGKDDTCEVPGHITRCEPPRLLSFTWGEGADASEVTFELTPQGKKVLLVVIHRRLGDLDTIVNAASGWHAHLGLLEDRLAGREARPFWTTKLRLEREYYDRLRERA